MANKSLALGLISARIWSSDFFLIQNSFGEDGPDEGGDDLVPMPGLSPPASLL